MDWYQELAKPAWAPPAPVFGIIVVLVTIVWSMIAIWPHARWASLALSPYLVWVMIATALQSSITWLNR